MKRIVLLALGACALAPVFAQTSVGISIGINQPGVYGRINIGDFPQPQVVYQQPIVITQSPVVINRQPIYMYVPEKHQKNWGKHCGRYNACGQPVYFVQEDWVRERYEERHHQKDKDRGDHQDRGRGHGKGKHHKN